MKTYMVYKFYTDGMNASPSYVVQTGLTKQQAEELLALKRQLPQPTNANVFYDLKEEKR